MAIHANIVMVGLMDDGHFYELLRDDLRKLQHSINSAAELFNIIHLNATSDSSTSKREYTKNGFDEADESNQTWIKRLMMH